MVDRLYLGVRLILRVTKVLNLSHRELSNSQQTLSWWNLVAEAHAYLGSCERHSAIVELIESFEVNENSLCGLWSEVSLHVATWADLQREHHVESRRIWEIIASIRVFNLKLSYYSIDVRSCVVITIHCDLFECRNFLWLFLFRQNLGDVLLDKLIGASAHSSFDVFHHKISKLIYMPTCLEHVFDSNVCCCHL